MEAVFVGVIPRSVLIFLFMLNGAQWSQCSFIYLICGSFVQTTGREVADLPVSHELGKNIYSMYSEEDFNNPTMIDDSQTLTPRRNDIKPLSRIPFG